MSEFGLVACSLICLVNAGVQADDVNQQSTEAVIRHTADAFLALLSLSGQHTSRYIYRTSSGRAGNIVLRYLKHEAVLSSSFNKLLHDSKFYVQGR